MCSGQERRKSNCSLHSCPVPSMAIESVAPNMGWGAYQAHHQTGRKWSLEEATHHINYLDCFSSTTVLCQTQQRGHNSDKVGQFHSSVIYQHTRGNALPDTVQLALGTDAFRRMSFWWQNTCQYNSRSGVMINKGSLQLGAKSLDL